MKSRILYAIVDIETTGSYAGGNGITEIAIRIHDGEKVVEKFETLINPEQRIPYFITSLTGIDDEMVRNAPIFQEVAARIFNLLHDKIFIAHNVNFDFSFVKNQLAKYNYHLTNKKLCTVRLARKVLPGHASYSLGKLCRSLDLPLQNQHRAAGDADATVLLFERIIENDTQNHILEALKKNSKEQMLPPHLAKAQIDKLPQTAGVYQFKNEKGVIVYVGKAKNIKQRVISHFSSDDTGRKRQDFLKSIYTIEFKESGTEIMALIEEANLIKTIWPIYNRSLKSVDIQFGVYKYEDVNGFFRLVADRKRKLSHPELIYATISLAMENLRALAEENSLCFFMCGLQKKSDLLEICSSPECLLCNKKVSKSKYNKKVETGLKTIKKSLDSFVIKTKGRVENENGYVMIENGHVTKLGFLTCENELLSKNFLSDQLTPCPLNFYNRNLAYQHANEFPEELIFF